MDADTTPTPAPRRRGRIVAAALAAAAIALAIPVSGAFAGSDDSSGTSSAKPAQRDGHRGDCPKDKDRGGDSSGTSFDSSTEL
jgi:hypothetical protein